MRKSGKVSLVLCIGSFRWAELSTSQHNTDLYGTADASSTARRQTLQAAPYELSSSDDDDDHESEHSTDEVLVLCCKDKVRRPSRCSFQTLTSPLL